MTVNMPPRLLLASLALACASTASPMALFASSTVPMASIRA